MNFRTFLKNTNICQILMLQNLNNLEKKKQKISLVK